MANVRQAAFAIRKAGMHSQSPLESMLTPVDKQQSNRGQKRPHDDDEDKDSDDDQAHDEVRLWEDGFKDRYYESKFDASPDNLDFRCVFGIEFQKTQPFIF